MRNWAPWTRNSICLVYYRVLRALTYAWNIVVVPLLSRVWLFVALWTAARQDYKQALSKFAEWMKEAGSDKWSGSFGKYPGKLSELV